MLLRPKSERLHRLDEPEIDTLLIDLARHAIVLSVGVAAIATSQVPPAPDAGDQFLWDLLTSRNDLLLVTGDKALHASGPLQKRIVTPLVFMAQVLG